MKRALAETPGFARALRRFLKRHPQTADDIRSTLVLLSENAHDSRLGTHKLHGDLVGQWACSVGYDVRIVFEFGKLRNAEVIVLHNVGTHDEVY